MRVYSSGKPIQDSVAFSVNLGYIVSLRLAWVLPGDPD